MENILYEGKKHLYNISSKIEKYFILFEENN
jgi:hypothetical protein